MTAPERTINDQLFDIEIRLAAIEKQLARLIPLVEVAEKYLSMSPMDRVRASLRKP